jgi:hypothetical protein
MKAKQIMAIAALCIAMVGITGCDEASRASYNLTREADNFNTYRRITVINCITGDTLMQLEGRCAIAADINDNQLEVVTEYEKGQYNKQIIGLSDNVTYLVEDLETKDVNEYHYYMNFNPHMWLPEMPTYID